MPQTTINLLASGHHAVPLLENAGQIIGNAHILSKKALEAKPQQLNEGQVLVSPLHELAVPVGEGLTIAALIAEYNPALRLYVAPALQDKKMLGIEKKATVFCKNSNQAIQLQDFRPDLKIVVKSLGIHELLEQENCKAFVVSAQSLKLSGLLGQHAHKITDWSHYEFNPVEFIPQAGQDVLALVTASSDKPTRRFLKTFHQEEISRRTNIERQLLKLAPKLSTGLSAFCQVDGNGYYQLHGMLDQGNRPKYAKASASSYLGLAEKVLNELLGT